MVCKGDVLTGEILAAAWGPRGVKAGGDPAVLESLATLAEEVAVQAGESFGADFFGELPLRMQTWAAWARSLCG